MTPIISPPPSQSSPREKEEEEGSIVVFVVVAVFVVVVVVIDRVLAGLRRMPRRSDDEYDDDEYEYEYDEYDDVAGRRSSRGGAYFPSSLGRRWLARDNRRMAAAGYHSGGAVAMKSKYVP